MNAMVPNLFIILVLLAPHISSDSVDTEDTFEQYWTNVTDNPKNKKTLDEHFEQYSQLSQEVDTSFSCHFKSPTCTQDPTSVHSLRPCDIDVVAALGDSITAGNGAKATNILEVLVEYRGVSWSIGGDEPYTQVHTLPNILRRYNPNIKGFSVNQGKVNSADAHLDLAIPGKTSSAMLQEAKDLVCRIHKETGVNFLNDWKVVTLFIGGNNLCGYCQDPTANSASQYISDVTAALDYLHTNMPRTFVNLVQVLNVTFINQLNTNPICVLTHSYLCSCALGASTIPVISKLLTDYHTGIQKLIDSGRYDTREDFSVVIQPFLMDSKPPLLAGTEDADMSYFAPDCFHLSQKGHAFAAHGLWNNMLQPLGSKQRDWNSQGGVMCPYEGQYFATSKNTQTQNNNLQLSQTIRPYTSTVSFQLLVICLCTVATLIVVGAVIVVIKRRRRSTPYEQIHLLHNSESG